MIEWVKKHYMWLLVGVVALGMVLSTVLAEDQNPVVNFTPNEENERIIEETYIYVDVKGAVEHPGVYKLVKDSRLFQVIEMAGGLTSDADGNAINFSIILADQDVFYIPTTEEGFPNVTIIDDSTVGGVININVANMEALETLPGIGPATAQNIIDYRDENGPFGTIEDIMNVSGIGESTFNEIKDHITV